MNARAQRLERLIERWLESHRLPVADDLGNPQIGLIGTMTQHANGVSRIVSTGGSGLILPISDLAKYLDRELP